MSSAQFVENFKDIINDGGCVPLIVTGNSMLPFLANGRDTVWLSACKNEDLKKGKILLFERDNGNLVLHRVKRLLSQDKLEMNGDAQYWCETIKKEQVIAAVSHIEKNGKKISCNSIMYIIRVRLWQALKPLRPLIFKVWRKLTKKAVNRENEC